MPRLRDTKSGAVVSVRDEKVDLMGSEWELADKPAPKAAAKKSSSSKSDK